jgi:N-formylglutamate amidohydrolase
MNEYNTLGLDFDKIEYNTLSGLNLFSDEIESSFIFHIPHSKTEIPEQFKSDFVSTELMESEIKLLTDFATDEIFTIGNTTKLVFPYSRIFCDVERLDDENEVMFEYGRGFYYTKTDSGQLLRENLNGNKELIYNDFYLKHHEALTNLVDQKLNKNNFPLIVDCHSFADTPFSSDIEQGADRPDFCIGTDELHTPKWLVNMVYAFLTNQGYSVKINYPYVGTIVPMKHYQVNENVRSIMIEINRKLYMDDGIVNDSKVSKLNQLMSDLFLVKKEPH